MALNYDDDCGEVEIGDLVQLNDGSGKGVITKIHAKQRKVTVRYETGEYYRTTGCPRERTEKFLVADVNLLRRAY